MKPLLQGIYNKFTSSTSSGSFYDDVGGRLRLIEAEQNSVYPYAVYNLVINLHERTFKSDTEDATVEFILISDSTGGADEIMDMYDHLNTLYDGQTLSLSTISDYSNAVMRRDDSWLNKMPGTVASDKKVWQYNVTFDVRLHKED